MYAVVGCRDCGALWVVADRPETTGCPRCGKRHRFERLHRFVETDDEDRARQARAELLADRGDHGDAFGEVEGFATLGEHIEAGGVSDREYLAGSGLDVDAVEAAGERAGRGDHRTTGSRRDVVRGAIDALDEPTASAVVEHAAERGVPPDATRDLLERLVRAGEATEHRGRYRLL